MRMRITHYLVLGCLVWFVTLTVPVGLRAEDEKPTAIDTVGTAASLPLRAAT